MLFAVPVAVLVLLSATDRTPPLSPIGQVRGADAISAERRKVDFVVLQLPVVDP